MKELFLEYKYPIIGGLIGLVLALFFFTCRHWRYS